MISMPKRIPKTRAEWVTWARNAEQKSPGGFCLGVLALAALLMLVHYMIDELNYGPERNLWTAPAFWSGAWVYAAAPFVNWFAWKLLAAPGRLRSLKPILIMATILCAGSALLICIPNMLRSIESMHLYRFDPPIEKWRWFSFRFYWRYWTLIVLFIGNLVLLWRWWTRIERPVQQSRYQANSSASRTGVILKLLAAICVTAACAVTTLHLILPRLPANQDVLGLTRTFLVKPRLRNDFDYLVERSFSYGQPLAPLLAHVELADLQRHQFYANLPEATFREDVLSPQIDRLPLDELDWRRALWESFYPRIRQEADPLQAAQIIVRLLRQRVGIDSSYDYRVGVETIWTEHMTDETGFERIYVAALRSVGIASRLNSDGKAELLENDKWQSAPRLQVYSFEDKKFPVLKGGLVNFRNWAGNDWPSN